MEYDIQNIDIPNLIRNEHINNIKNPWEYTDNYVNIISSIKDYENTLTKAFTNNKNPCSTNPFLYLWRIETNNSMNNLKNNLTETNTKKINNDLFPYSIPLDLSLYGINLNKISKDVVIIGPQVRKCLINNLLDDNKTRIKTRNEIYIFKITNTKWNDLININLFEEKQNEYVYEDYDKKIYIVKNVYKSPAHVILQHQYLKRVGWFDNAFYVSSMFLIEYQKHKSWLNMKINDPIFDIPYDPLDIIQIPNKDTTHPINIINSINYIGLKTLNKKNLIRLFNGKTCIEHCLDKFLKETHPILKNQLKQMLLYLIFIENIEYRRPPYLYGKLLNIDNSLPELYNLLKQIKCKYNIQFINEENISSIEDINNYIIKNIIKDDNVKNFIDYIEYSKTKIDKLIIDYSIEYDSRNIQEYIINTIQSHEHMIYHLILMSENFELLNYVNFDLNLDIAINFMKDILSSGKIRSFFYLYKMDNSLIDMIFDGGKNVLHCIEPNGNYKDLIDLIIKLKPDIINITDNDMKTPVIYHAQYNPLLVSLLLNYSFDGFILDNENNTFIHYLCMSDDNINVLRDALQKYSELIDYPNKKLETPAIITCKYNNEDSYYLIKSMSANLRSKDCYGNTVFHYICHNNMCLGMIIENTKNHFGLTPYDYCCISPSYYNFTDSINY